MKLKLADDLTLPVDIVTQTIAILAKRRAGKSYAMRRLVEQLHHAAQQVVLVDPKGDQWGIRSAADGKAPGLPFIIIGGERGDVPLEEGSGGIVAKLVVEERVSVVLDLSLFRKNEIAQFMGGTSRKGGGGVEGFLEVLYRLKAREAYRTPMMLVIDEADAIAPQKPQPGEERMLGAAEDIVRRGGQRGIGCCAVTQRSAVLNKNVLTQSQILIALRTIAPQDLKAMDAWVDVHGTIEERKTLMDSLPALPIGDAWIWSPGWPTVDGIFKRVHVLPIETYDSGASPDPGQKKRAEPKTVADVDLEALKRQMAATIEKAKAEDPRELRKQIADLKKQIATAKPPENYSKIITTPKPEKVKEIAVLKDGQLARAEKLIATVDSTLDRYADRIDKAIGDFQAKHYAEMTRLRGIAEVIGTAIASTQNTHATDARVDRRPLPASSPGRGTVPAATVSRPAPRVSSESNGNLTGPEQRIVDAIMWLESIGVVPAEQTAVAFLANYTYGAGGFNNPRGALRQAGLVEYIPGERIQLTDAGRALAHAPDTPLETDELHRRVLARLPGPEQRLLRPLLESYPKPMSNEDLAAAANYALGTGGFNNPKGRLRSLGLIDYPQPGFAVAKSLLFLEDR